MSRLSRKRAVDQINSDDASGETVVYPSRKKIRMSKTPTQSTKADVNVIRNHVEESKDNAVPTEGPTLKKNVSSLQKKIRAAAQTTFERLGPGLTESVYRDALAVELQHCRVQVCSDREVILPIRHRGRYVGYCRSDIVLLCSTAAEASEQESDGRPIVVELKAVSSALNSCNVQQLCAYMRLLSARQGVLINFLQGDAEVQNRLNRLRALDSASTNVSQDHCLCLSSESTKIPTVQCIFVQWSDDSTESINACS